MLALSVYQGCAASGGVYNEPRPYEVREALISTIVHRCGEHRRRNLRCVQKLVSRYTDHRWLTLSTKVIFLFVSYHPIARKMIDSDLQKAIAADPNISEIVEQETDNGEYEAGSVQKVELEEPLHGSSSPQVGEKEEVIPTVEEKELQVSLPTDTESPSVPDTKQDYLWELVPPAEPLPIDEVSPLVPVNPSTEPTAISVVVKEVVEPVVERVSEGITAFHP